MSDTAAQPEPGPDDTLLGVVGPPPDTTPEDVMTDEPLADGDDVPDEPDVEAAP